jgi:hypothetical protein
VDAIRASRLREDERYHGLLANNIVARCEPASGSWGAHIYRSDSTGSFPRSRPRACPEWAEARDWDRWFHEGLVVWDNATQRIGAISSDEAVKFIEALGASDDWKMTGIPIVERTHMIIPPTPAPARRSKKKAAGPESAPRPPKEEIREDERLRLTGAAAEDLCAFLRSHEGLLRRLAADREKRAQEALSKVYELILGSKNRREADEIQLGDRAFPWRREPGGEFVADVPPDRATVKLMDNGIWWQSILERPGHFKWDRERFLRLDEALKWAEGEIPRLRRENEDETHAREEEKAADLALVAALPTQDLTPFWIDPAAMEPEQITYRAYIELDYGPATSKQEEISFGEYWLFDEKYFTAAQLAGELRLNASQAEVHQLDPEMDMYRIYSRGTFSDAPAAAAQAQQIWDQSAMVERFAEKKVKRARYGYQELETEYCVWLGWLEQKPWPHWTRQESRPAYMKDRAMGETLSYALDLNGYRKHFQVGFNLVPDEGLLWKLHYRRSRSKYVSSDARSESQKWVRAHPIEEAFPLRKVKTPKPA